jgi:hypothetical protein
MALIIGAQYFAERKKSANGENAPWFRVNFAGAKFPLGEAQEVLAYSRSDKPDKSCKDFCLFLQLFLSKRKSLYESKAAGFRKNKNPPRNRRILFCFIR